MFRIQSPVFALLLLLGWVAGSPAASVTYNLSDRNARKQIVFESKAPLEYIEGNVTRIEGQVTVDTSRPDLGLTGSVHIPVEAMDTANGQRDQHLKSVDWMNADAFPAIRFVLDPPTPNDIVRKSSGKWFVQAKGDFLMKGQTRKITAPVTLEIKKHGTEEKLSLQGRFSLRLSDFGIRGPAAVRMMGVRVSETVNVSLNLVGVADKGWGGLEKPRRQRLKRY